MLDAHPIADGDVGPTLTFSKADHDLYDQYYVQDAAVAEMPTVSTMLSCPRKPYAYVTSMQGM